jgi:hypothetical protein
MIAVLLIVAYIIGCFLLGCLIGKMIDRGSR